MRCDGALRCRSVLDQHWIADEARLRPFGRLRNSNASFRQADTVALGDPAPVRQIRIERSQLLEADRSLSIAKALLVRGRLHSPEFGAGSRSRQGVALAKALIQAAGVAMHVGPG